MLQHPPNPAAGVSPAVPDDVKAAKAVKRKADNKLKYYSDGYTKGQKNIALADCTEYQKHLNRKILDPKDSESVFFCQRFELGHESGLRNYADKQKKLAAARGQGAALASGDSKKLSSHAQVQANLKAEGDKEPKRKKRRLEHSDSKAHTPDIQAGGAALFRLFTTPPTATTEPAARTTHSADGIGQQSQSASGSDSKILQSGSAVANAPVAPQQPESQQQTSAAAALLPPSYAAPLPVAAPVMPMSLSFAPMPVPLAPQPLSFAPMPFSLFIAILINKLQQPLPPQPSQQPLHEELQLWITARQILPEPQFAGLINAAFPNISRYLPLPISPLPGLPLAHNIAANPGVAIAPPPPYVAPDPGAQAAAFSLGMRF